MVSTRAGAIQKGKRHRMFSILVRGIWFDVIVDKNAGAEWKALCCVQSNKKVLHLTDCHRRFMHAAGTYPEDSKGCAEFGSLTSHQRICQWVVVLRRPTGGAGPFKMK